MNTNLDSIARNYKADASHSKRIEWMDMSNRFLELNENGYVKNRESFDLEFKEAFHLGDSLFEYIRSMVGMANNRGGRIIFGVKNSPRIPVGLKNDKFQSFDQKDFNNRIVECFDTEVEFEMKTIDFNGHTFGEVVISESSHKPHVCRRTHQKILREGAIYYRYRGETKEIRYAELQRILLHAREIEGKMWRRLFSKIAKVGVDRVALLDTMQGELSGHSGSILVSDELLSHIRFVNEGRFVETSGEPVLKLMGEVRPVSSRLISGVRKVSRPVAISGSDIIHAFLSQKDVESPIEYLKQICHEDSANFPIYYFIAGSGKTLPEIVRQISETVSRKPGKGRLAKRLASDSDFVLAKLNVDSHAAELRKKWVKKIIEEDIQMPISSEEAGRFFEAITCLDSKRIDGHYLLPILEELYAEMFETFDSSTASKFRKTVCFIDKQMYFNAVKK